MADVSNIDRDLKDSVVGRLYELRSHIDDMLYEHYSREGLREELEDIDRLIEKVENL